MNSIIKTMLFLVGALIGYFINPDPKPSPSPRGFMISYQAGITNNMTKVGNVLVGGHPFTDHTINGSINLIMLDTNVIRGSVVILNAVPVY